MINIISKKQCSYYYGFWAEVRVVFYLKVRGYKLLKKRYKTKLGEVDLIALKKGCLHFVEVKARRTNEVERLSNAQQKRIANAARLFIAKYPEFVSFNMQFDLAMVTGIFQVKYLKNAWRSV